MTMGTLALHIKSSWIDFHLGWLSGGFLVLLFILSFCHHQLLQHIFLMRKINNKWINTLNGWRHVYSFVVLRNSRPPKYFSNRFCRAAPTPSKYNRTTDNRSFNITLLQYQRIVRVPGRDIEWELRVPPFCLGRASELIRQINERWTYVGAQPLSVPPCHLSIPWIPAQSDSGQPFTVAPCLWICWPTPAHYGGLLWPCWNSNPPWLRSVKTVYIWFYQSLWFFSCKT